MLCVIIDCLSSYKIIAMRGKILNSFKVYTPSNMNAANTEKRNLEKKIFEKLCDVSSFITLVVFIETRLWSSDNFMRLINSLELP